MSDKRNKRNKNNTVEITYNENDKLYFTRHQVRVFNYIYDLLRENNPDYFLDESEYPRVSFRVNPEDYVMAYNCLQPNMCYNCFSIFAECVTFCGEEGKESYDALIKFLQSFDSTIEEPKNGQESAIVIYDFIHVMSDDNYMCDQNCCYSDPYPSENDS